MNESQAMLITDNDHDVIVRVLYFNKEKIGFEEIYWLFNYLHNNPNCNEIAFRDYV